jgi:hypothetical protein
MKLPRLLLALFLILPWADARPAAAQTPACEYKLGFKLIADQMPETLGACLENEHFNPANGNSEQRTTAHHGQGGLLVWRKADNWTAFTDGHRTWVNGPFGLQERLNTERFEWESDPILPPTPVEAPPPVAQPPYPAAVVNFSLDSTTIAVGQCSTARWSTANARAIFLLGAGVDTAAQPAAGDRQVCPTASTIYTLNVVDLGGTTITRAITLNVSGTAGPTVNFWADRTTINLGDCAVLRWDVQNVRAIHLRGPDLDIGVPGQGERSVCPRTTSAEYRLDVTDQSGNTSTRSITINVPNAQPTAAPQPTATPTPPPAPSPTAQPSPTTQPPTPTRPPPTATTRPPTATPPPPTATTRPQPTATTRP